MLIFCSHWPRSTAARFVPLHFWHTAIWARIDPYHYGFYIVLYDFRWLYMVLYKSFVKGSHLFNISYFHHLLIIFKDHFHCSLVKLNVVRHFRNSRFTQFTELCPTTHPENRKWLTMVKHTKQCAKIHWHLVYPYKIWWAIHAGSVFNTPGAPN